VGRRQAAVQRLGTVVRNTCLCFVLGLVVLTGWAGSKGSKPFAPAAKAMYTVVDVSVPNLAAVGLYGASNGYQVGAERLGTFRCGRGTRNIDHAYLFHGSANTAVDVNPAGAVASDFTGIKSGVEVGSAQFGTGCALSHAGLWRGTAASFVDLHPTGVYGTTNGTFGLGTDGIREVGYGLDGGNAQHAFVWSGTATSIVDITPAGMYGFATGVSGTRVVGAGLFGPGGPGEALVWVGKTYAVLACTPCYNWFASGIDGKNIVGYGNAFAASYHALFWHGTAAQAIDLNPPTAAGSFALGVRGKFQVGYTVSLSHGANVYHAAVWSGSSASYIDLETFLPTSYTASYAYGVDEAGNVVGGAIDGVNGIHSIIWERTTNTR
jgi:hypothetical protein